MGTRAAATVEIEKPRSLTERARRAQIVEAAIQLIAEHGYARATLGQIALHLGISKGVISYHFKSKDELVQEIITTTISEGTRFMSGYVGRGPSAAAELSAYIQGEVAFLKAHRDHALALVEIYNARVADYAPHREQFRAALEELLLRGQRDGEFRRFSARIMAITIRAAIESVPHLLVEDPSFGLDSYARELRKTFAAATRAEGL